MEEYIAQIEKFLKEQMNQKEESAFKKSLTKDAHLRSCAFIMAFILKAQKLR